MFGGRNTIFVLLKTLSVGWHFALSMKRMLHFSIFIFLFRSISHLIIIFCISHAFFLLCFCTMGSFLMSVFLKKKKSWFCNFIDYNRFFEFSLPVAAQKYCESFFCILTSSASIGFQTVLSGLAQKNNPVSS